ncbi:MAG: hypothetical protein OEM62_04535 [Acidobacteriota bacterium]|nr:hypothetical protein [Acidobacteriota bacterium]
MSALVLRLFTHPACSGCPEAVREAWKFTENRTGIELRTVTLAEKDGLAEARRAHVTTIPALILERGDDELARWEGMPALADLEAAVQVAAAPEAAPAP